VGKQVRGARGGGDGSGDGGETTSNDNAHWAAQQVQACQGKGAPQKCTDHNLASERQQAHTRKRVPTAAPATPTGPTGQNKLDEVVDVGGFALTRRTPTRKREQNSRVLLTVGSLDYGGQSGYGTQPDASRR
jgi:hypothetical protein